MRLARVPQVDPVILATGHTYDRSSIERWLEQGHKTCPVTGMRLRHLELTPNFALRSAIQVCVREHSCHTVAIPRSVLAQPDETLYNQQLLKKISSSLLPGS